MIVRLIFLLVFLSSGKAKLHSQIDTSAIQLQLETMFFRDQSVRRDGSSGQLVHETDSANMAQLRALIDTYGWLHRSVVGYRGNLICALILQHAELPDQQQYLPLLEQSMLMGQSSKSDYALLCDRVLMREGKKQRYGSQVVFNESGEQVFYPVEDPENINTLRAAMELEPIEAYAERFGIQPPYFK